MAYALAAAAVAIPMSVGAVTFEVGDDTPFGGGEFTFTSGADRAVVPFTADGVDATYSLAVAGASFGEYLSPADALLSLQFGVADTEDADVTGGFSAVTDFLNPSSASSNLGPFELPAGATQYLIFEFAEGFAFQPGETLLVDYTYGAELRPVDPGEPGVIPLPAPAFLLMGGLATFGLLRRKQRA